MIAQSAKKRKHSTYQDVLNAPSNMVAEIIGGTLHTHPRPASLHVLAGLSLGSELLFTFGKGRGGPGGWWILSEPELHLDGEITVPDLAGWRRETMPEYPESPYFEIVPDWVCEILSPSTRKFDLYEKRPFYAARNIAHLWLVDPVERELEAFELRDGQWLLIAALKENDAVSVPPFDAISFSLADLWPDTAGDCGKDQDA